VSAAVLATGAVSSVGLSAPATAAAQRASVPGHAAHPFMIDRAGEPMIVSRVPWGEQELDGTARIIELALPAAREAVGSFARERPIDLLLALPEPRPGLAAGYAPIVETALIDGLTPDLRIGRHRAVAGGHAAGLAFISQAAALLAREPDALLLVGGVDSWVVPETLEWLDELEALHTTTMPWGFCPGEAACFCLLGGEQRGGRLTVIGGARPSRRTASEPRPCASAPA
jgi:3-oxoacyl-[acyl-carrier-protein] synthase I